ncbi:MAG: hypothetical protein JRF64_12130, partial [Deltaproteobacteria bacterium]|nr:hypothetical protein [Deltaproteobacteria bacterium]
YLLYGDEFLHRSAFKSVLNALIQPDHQDMNYEAIDGAGENVYEIIQHLNTFPLIPSAKVVAVHGTRIFYSAVVMDDLLGRSKEAFEMEDLEESARYLLYTFSMAGISLDDVREGGWKGVSDKKLRERFEQEDNSGWLGQVIAHCLQEKMVVPVHQDDADVLNDAILSGYPETNYLVLTADLVDKRRRLYKTIKKIGVVVDCSVPKGDRKADKDRQQAALKTHMKMGLSHCMKRSVRTCAASTASWRRWSPLWGTGMKSCPPTLRQFQREPDRTQSMRWATLLLKGIHTRPCSFWIAF